MKVDKIASAADDVAKIDLRAISNQLWVLFDTYQYQINLSSVGTVKNE